MEITILFIRSLLHLFPNPKLCFHLTIRIGDPLLLLSSCYLYSCQLNFGVVLTTLMLLSLGFSSIQPEPYALFPFLYNLARCVLCQINRIASANLNSRLSLSVFCICQLYFACWGGSHCESPQHDVRYRSQNDVAALLETIASVEQRKWSFSRACTILNISKCLLIQTREFLVA